MSAKSKDTTKTAHVMSLLRKNTGTDEPQDNQQPAAEGAAVESKPTATKHPIIASLNEEASVALEIRDALEMELDKSAQEDPIVDPSAPLQEDLEAGETPAEAVVEEDLQASCAVPEVPETLELMVPSSTEEPVQTEVVQQEPAVEETPVANEDSPVADAEPAEPSLQCYNVIQVMVDESAKKYMKMFNLCQCPRCRADVRALALNNLQPKYVVMEPGEYIPRITLYERQFNSTVTAQVLRACTIVSESPRH